MKLGIVVIAVSLAIAMSGCSKSQDEEMQDFHTQLETESSAKEVSQSENESVKSKYMKDLEFVTAYPELEKQIYEKI